MWTRRIIHYSSRTFLSLTTSICRVTQKVVSGVYQGVTTVELDVSSWFKTLILSLPNIKASRLHCRAVTPGSLLLALASRFQISTRKPKKEFSPQVIKDLNERIWWGWLRRIISCLNVISLFNAGTLPVKTHSAHPSLSPWKMTQ